ncbi:glycosyltransferase family 39 protein [Tsuneonella flava]|uniref:Glycosyltransferase family 39 protein n=1 Tax=Tsuneonella flava TaxID=2055955 RepID=A0ABX7K889_9SPHN|nr:glycosyltransferase family 39 protein [Tsuneonella flava]QSB44484.1 glycosyltransferase family 39 protein [Tsuneonella flava]
MKSTAFVSNERWRLILALIILCAVVMRLAATWVLAQPLESDSLSYFTMAQSLAERGELVDIYGQHVFFSAGYPLFLSPFFAVFGSSIGVALGVNAVLCVIGTWLIYRLALTISGNRFAGALAAAAYAVWLPGIWNATMLAKENLSTPLLLAIALCAIDVARNKRPIRAAMVGGLLWGAALVTGGSALLLCAGIAIALLVLWRAQGFFAPALAGGLGFLVGAAVMLAPWLYATDQMVGRPVLTTNAAFNLYLGNNPAATGKFVSIADTPMGRNWEATRLKLGEVGNADRLQAEAMRWIRENLARAAELAACKLAYFWQPNLMDAEVVGASKAFVLIRLVEVIQYGLIVVFGLAALRSRLIAGDAKWIFAAMIVGFWLVHAAAYIITRYRDPVMPLLIVLAVIPVAKWLEQFILRRITRHAA